MYNQDPKRKRRQLKIRYFTYGVMTFAVIAITTLGFFFLLGYRFDADTRQFVQGSLVKFDSQPQSARVLVDGIDIGSTSSQSNILAGNHTLRYTRSGYQDWAKDFSVNAGQLLWFDYAKLIPKDITTSIAHTFPGFEYASVSPNHEWILVREQAAGLNFTLVDVRNELKPTVKAIALPDAIIKKDAQSASGLINVVSWSYNAERVLLSQVIGEQTFYYVMPIEQPAQTVFLGEKLSAPQFASSLDDVLYAINESGATVRLSLSDTASSIIQTYENKYLSTKPYSNTKFAFTESTDPTKQRLQIFNDGELSMIEESAIETPLKPLFYDLYRGSEYLAYSVGNRLVVVRDPSDASNRKQVYNEMLAFEPTVSMISPANHFLFVGNGLDGFVVNLERNEKKVIKLQNADARAIMWLDEYHFGMSDGQTASIVDYDGTNTQRIVSIAGLTPFLLGQDLEVMLSIGKNNVTGSLELQSSSLVAK